MREKRAVAVSAVAPGFRNRGFRATQIATHLSASERLEPTGNGLNKPFTSGQTPARPTPKPGVAGSSPVAPVGQRPRKRGLSFSRTEDVGGPEGRKATPQQHPRLHSGARVEVRGPSRAHCSSRGRRRGLPARGDWLGTDCPRPWSEARRTRAPRTCVERPGRSALTSSHTQDLTFGLPTSRLNGRAALRPAAVGAPQRNSADLRGAPRRAGRRPRRRPVPEPRQQIRRDKPDQ
jgi:hypothetical protein